MDKLPDQLSDEDLMKLILHENHFAYTQLVTRHTSRFYALAYRTLLDKVAAEDIVQDAFLQLWRNPHKWNASKGVKFTTWFYKITLNLSLDYNKKKRPLLLDEEFDTQDETSNLECALTQLQKNRRWKRPLLNCQSDNEQHLTFVFTKGEVIKKLRILWGWALKHYNPY